MWVMPEDRGVIDPGPVAKDWSAVMDTITRPTPYPHLRARPLVSRVALLELLEASGHATVITVLAPPGYGKTTLVGQWADRDPRPFGWLTIDHHDNDPAVLLRNLAVTLDRAEPLGRELMEALTAPAGTDVDAVLARLGSVLSAAALPLVLVLDDFQVLQSRDGLQLVGRLIDCLPTGSQLAIAGREEPRLPLARLRAEGRVLEVRPGDLAMDQQEASALLKNAELDVETVDVRELVHRTEGWPVALQLAASRARARTGHRAPAVAMAGDDRFLADYLEVVLLSRLPSRVVGFLTRCAVLDRMSGPLCDAVLDTTGSADLLEWLSRSNALVIPVDRRRRWYRLHRLFRELLRSRLERDEPAVAGQLTRRAADWCERNGLTGAAVDYAIAAGDADRAARLVVEVALPTYSAGGLSTLKRWFDWLETTGVADRDVALALLGAWLNALAGHPAAAERCAEAVERRPSEVAPADGTLPVEGPLALLEAALCRHGVERMRADVRAALRLTPTGSVLQATARLLLGISHLLAGDLHSADHSLADAAQMGEELGVDVAVVALAERSILAMNRGDWQQAELLAERARAAARAEWLEQYVSSALLHLALARLAIHHGDVPQARSALACAEALRPKLTYALPHLAVQVRLELARSYLALTDVAAAKTAMWEVDNLLWQRPELGTLRDQAEELRARLGAMRQGPMGGSSLTPAEVRLLRLLGTHYSFREIGGQLYLSQHTVKSQAMSIYRKFGVSSRSEAIQCAADLGLLVQ
jgi:LuxR family transcriptional regulator, maltose regulon positive regulatory protein